MPQPGSTVNPYITPADLVDRLNPTTFLAIYDDDSTNSVATVSSSNVVKQVIRLAHSRVFSRLPNLYKTPPNVDPNTVAVPDLLYDAELAYAVALSLQRHPEYVRTFGENQKVKQAFEQAEDIMRLLQDDTLRIADLPPAPSPLNVGGIITDNGQRVFIDSADGTRNGGDF